jgi:hypothetical protein
LCIAGYSGFKVVKNPFMTVPVKAEHLELSFPNDLHDFVLRGIVQQLYINFRVWSCFCPCLSSILLVPPVPSSAHKREYVSILSDGVANSLQYFLPI